MKMLTDNAVTAREDDKFGFAAYADLLGEAIRDTDRLPLTIGVFGAWGVGKTSLMHLLEERVSTFPKTRTAWFNPWKYERKEELWHALIQTVLYLVADEGSPQVAERARSLAAQAAWFAFRKGMSALTQGVLDSETLNRLKNVVTEQDAVHYRHIHRFEEDFAAVVRAYTDGGRLVVFVDDLDRCMPENAVTVLESLKLFLGEANCVFVLGMDHYIIEQGIKHRYGDRINMSGREYLEKIVQVPFYLPAVPFSRLKAALAVAKTQDYGKAVWKVVQYGLGGNPRKTKRFVNCFFLLDRVLRTPETYRDIRPTERPAHLTLEQERYYLAVLLVFQMSFTGFYAALRADPDLWMKYDAELLRADSVENRESHLARNPELKVFWEDTLLRSFVSALEDQFPVPGADVLTSLIELVSLVKTGSEGVASGFPVSGSQARGQ